MDAIIIWLIQTINTNTADVDGAGEGGRRGEIDLADPPPLVLSYQSRLHFTFVYFLFQFVI